MTAQNLPDYLEASASRYPQRVAIVDVNGQKTTYGDLARQADALARFLAASGVTRGDRVGVVLPKSIAAVVSMFGIMKAGAAYVPVDAAAPAERGRRILTDCQIRALIVDSRAMDFVPDELDPLSATIVLGAANGHAANTTPFEAVLERIEPAAITPARPIDLAYILYTSGSTGAPKGVMISHANVISFLDWCSSLFAPTPDDRFSSYAPFHFDPSVFDIYLAIKHGASVYLVSEALGKAPEEIARFIETHRLTVWCATSSALMLLTQFGKLETHDASSLRIVLSGGEVFPVKHLRELQQRWPSPAYYNVYGPTETCVFCTLSRIPSVIPDDREAPYPIGFPGPHCRVLVLNGDGREVTGTEEGFLHISGEPVFEGYWNKPTETASAFIERDGVRWYNTGDVVRRDLVDGLIYVGRRDGMVKRRGYRIELAEIERALYLHPRVREAAVVSVNAGTSARIVAFLTCEEADAPSIVELKTFCAAKLPAYMSPDQFVFRRQLPRTSTDKMDYQGLRRELSGTNAGA